MKHTVLAGVMFATLCAGCLDEWGPPCDECEPVEDEEESESDPDEALPGEGLGSIFIPPSDDDDK